MSNPRDNPAARPARHSNRGRPNSGRSNSGHIPSAQKNYERYLALAHAEAQNGNLISAENYYQHAEHYFRSMRPEQDGT
jgi:hypothetical protein